mmetsp:Transcript_30964/g.100872  ORF Transcript_30964/g.100872 Transcript_30964/m.100872 type:complete len:255 (+) Transcript_30964:301-1065(+)
MGGARVRGGRGGEAAQAARACAPRERCRVQLPGAGALLPGLARRGGGADARGWRGRRVRDAGALGALPLARLRAGDARADCAAAQALDAAARERRSAHAHVAHAGVGGLGRHARMPLCHFVDAHVVLAQHARAGAHRTLVRPLPRVTPAHAALPRCGCGVRQPRRCHAGRGGLRNHAPAAHGVAGAEHHPSVGARATRARPPRALPAGDAAPARARGARPRQRLPRLPVRVDVHPCPAGPRAQKAAPGQGAVQR